MPKMKTNRAAAKRFRKSKTGRVARFQAALRHNLGHRSRNNKRRLKGKAEVHHTDLNRVRALLPN